MYVRILVVRTVRAKRKLRGSPLMLQRHLFNKLIGGFNGLTAGSAGVLNADNQLSCSAAQLQRKNYFHCSF